jgi:quercetin dioxygenase-like cupin family protein
MVSTGKKAAVALALIAGSGLAARAAAPSPPRTVRTDLQRHDLSIAGHDALQTRIDFAPGVSAPRHRHPGEEIIYVLAGALEYRVADGPPITLKAGGVLFVPAETIHSARNVGRGHAVELATYVLEKGKPLITLAE